ncbi:response regulator [Brevibacterium senegalense]|uniref:response regulator n=1 Tax=Brevibacterium senegalense TaxID=1033736 RepID=UPI0002D35CDD|nr:response regulator [Brevibacterium senegalense]
MHTEQAEPTSMRVLIVEDDPMTAEAHADYVHRVPGFIVVGRCESGHEVLPKLEECAAADQPVDIVLLDMNLRDSHGLDVARRITQHGHDVGIIAVTAVRQLQVVKSALASGISQYLIKPFTFAVFREKLENQREFRLDLAGSGDLATQDSVDRAMSALRATPRTRLPKGLLEETLETVSSAMRQAETALSAAEMGERLDLSRVTVRRYLEHLAETRQVVKQPRHGTPGRPEYEYRWR